MTMPKEKTCFVIMPITTPEQSRELYNNDRDHFIHVLDHFVYSSN